MTRCYIVVEKLVAKFFHLVIIGKNSSWRYALKVGNFGLGNFWSIVVMLVITWWWKSYVGKFWDVVLLEKFHHGCMQWWGEILEF